VEKLLFEKEYKKAIEDNISFTYAFRYMLWVCAVCLPAISMLGVFVCAVLIWLALLGVSDAALMPMDNAVTSISQAAESTRAFAGSAGNIEASLQNVSDSYGSLADGLEQLSTGVGSIQVIGIAIPGTLEASAKLKQSSEQVRGASNAMAKAKTDVASGFSSLYLTADELDKTAASVRKSRSNVSETIFYLQVVNIILLFSIELALFAPIALAIAYGPPKRTTRGKNVKNKEEEKE